MSDQVAWIGPLGQLIPNEIFVDWRTRYPADAEGWKPLYTDPPQRAPAAPDGWRLEYGAAGFDNERWVCVRHLESQCGQDFYEKRDPLIFGFLAAMVKAA